jgi:Tetratricopeptide repeat
VLRINEPTNETERSQSFAARIEANASQYGTKPIGRVLPCDRVFRSNFLTILDVSAEEKRVANRCAPELKPRNRQRPDHPRGGRHSDHLARHQELPLKRRIILGLGLLGLVLLSPGCDYGAKKKAILPPTIVSGPLPLPPGSSSKPRADIVESGPKPPINEISPEEAKRREILLENFIKLIQTASNNPGGQNFAIATETLNDLFSQGTKPSDFSFSPSSKDFLLRKIYDLTRQDPEPVFKSLCSDRFTTRDARHIEDCMLYRIVANRVSGEGDDLTRVRRIFDWTVRNVELVPADSLSGNGLRQAEARPIDVLFRGMATEAGFWSERGWLFMSLCRQIGIDVGLLTYTPRASIMASPKTAATRPVVPWICAAIIDKKPYLFEQRIGMEIPGPDGTGVATLEEAINDPEVLGRLEIPGISVYGTTPAELANSTSKIGVLIDSSLGYLSPRMRLLQGQLRGEHRTTLFRDPLEQGANFKAAMGARLGLVSLWELPISVEERLFTDPNFVHATKMALQFFDSNYPLLFARTAQLRGDLAEATDKYVALRFAENAVMKNKEKTPIPAEVQRALDFYSTYFLAQCHMDRGNVKQAEDLYKKLVDMCPEPGPGRYFYYMLRWGALANLARIAEKNGDRASALSYYAQRFQTNDRHGQMFRARKLVWEHPFDEPAQPLPPAPPPTAAELKPEVRPEAKTDGKAEAKPEVPPEGKVELLPEIKPVPK